MGFELMLTRSKKNPILGCSNPMVYMNFDRYCGEYVHHDKDMLTYIASESRRS